MKFKDLAYIEKRRQWLKDRKNYIGGSDIATICHETTDLYKNEEYNYTPLDLYNDKVSPEIEISTGDTGKTENLIEPWISGHLLEPVTADMYCSITNNTVMEEMSPIRHPKHPFIAVNIDRWVNNKEFILECKALGFRQISKWGDPKTFEIPNQYKCQVAYQAAVCEAAGYNIPKVDLAVLIGGQIFRIYTYERDLKFEGQLIQLACDFWHEHIEKRIPPTDIRKPEISYPFANRLQLTGNTEIYTKFSELKELKKLAKEVNDKIELNTLEIKDFMQDHQILIDDQENILATWKNIAARESIDLKRFKLDHPAIYQQYLQESKPTRMFLLK